MAKKVVCKCLALNNKAIYSIVCDDETLCESVIRVFSSPTDKLKLRTIEVLIQGLLKIQNFIDHEDTLIIQLENQHLINWLVDETEYKGYDSLKDAINLIDSLDCTIRYEKVALKDLARILKSTEIKSEDKLGFADLFSEEGY